MNKQDLINQLKQIKSTVIVNKNIKLVLYNTTTNIYLKMYQIVPRSIFTFGNFKNSESNCMEFSFHSEEIYEIFNFKLKDISKEHREGHAGDGYQCSYESAAELLIKLDKLLKLKTFL